jgi:hypothetical protein
MAQLKKNKKKLKFFSTAADKEIMSILALPGLSLA